MIQLKELPESPRHGGALNQVIEKSALHRSQWLDLSTGVNPNGWPVPEIPGHVYNRLPETDDGLLHAARDYYQCHDILPVSGSQEAIQLLPFIFQNDALFGKELRIGIISPCYAEHEFHWRKNNFTSLHLNRQNVDQHIDTLDILLLINPNNPTGELLDIDTIKGWLQHLRANNAYLIIDEAFMDGTPKKSVLGKLTAANLIVLRSVGKFFGLAGVRCGFVHAAPEIIALLEYHQGPWSVSGPTRYLVTQALQDKNWIKENRKRLKKDSQQLKKLLNNTLLGIDNKAFLRGTLLFKTLYIDSAKQIYELLTEQGVLVRLLDKSCLCQSCRVQFEDINAPYKGIRFGLPADEQQWQVLETALKHVCVELADIDAPRASAHPGRC